MAPEVFENKEYSYPCDIWSMGICLLTLINLKNPFEEIGDINNDIINKIKDNTFFI